MRDRLIELLNTCQDRGQRWNYFESGQSVESVTNEILADHLLANGVIVPPVKIGDTVYYITGIHNTLVKGAKVKEIYIGESGFAYHLCTGYDYFTLQQDEIFLTREEAERALKGGEG